MKLISSSCFFKTSDYFYQALEMFISKNSRYRKFNMSKYTLILLFYISVLNKFFNFVMGIYFIKVSLKSPSNFLRITANVSCTGYVFHSLFKILYFYRNFKKCILLIEGLNLYLSKDEEVKILNKIKLKLKIVFKIGALYSFAYLFAIMAFNVLPFVLYLIEFSTNSSSEKVEYKFPYIPLFPFRIDNFKIYVVVYICQVLSAFTAAFVSKSCNIFMFSMILLICINFNYIEDNISKDAINLINVIKHHQNVLRFLLNITIFIIEKKKIFLQAFENFGKFIFFNYFGYLYISNVHNLLSIVSSNS